MIYVPTDERLTDEALYLSGVHLRVCGEALGDPDWETILAYQTMRYERFIMEQAARLEEAGRLLGALADPDEYGRPGGWVDVVYRQGAHRYEQCQYCLKIAVKAEDIVHDDCPIEQARAFLEVGEER